jgi:protein transport protein SEC24
MQIGLLNSIAYIMKDCLDHIPNADNRTLIGFITYDSSLHFYNLNSNLSEPQMMIVGDLEDVFLPLPEDLLVNLSESKSAVLSLLEKLPELHKGSQNVGNALGPALQAAQQMLSPIGGKIIVLNSSLPNANAGALKTREDKNKLDSSIFQPANAFYKQLAVDCSRCQIGIDMFLFGQAYVDVSTLCCSPRFTSGNTYLYPNWNSARKADAEKFSNEFSHILSRPIALEAVLRVRASRGLRMSVYHGNFFVRSTDLLALPNVNPDNTYSIEVSIDEAIQSSVVCFQTALLHTSAFGERRIRVLTLALPVTSSLSDIFHSVDTGALVNLLARKAIERAIESKFEDARDAIINKLVDILGTYKGVNGSNAQSQVLVPENLKLLPLLCLGLMKHPALRLSQTVSPDLRAYYMELLRVSGTEETLTQLHPVFYPLHRLLVDFPEVGTIQDGVVKMPPFPLPSTSERLERNGMYLLFDGVSIYIWVSRGSDMNLILALFGTQFQSYESLPSGPITLEPTGHPLCERTLNIIGKIRERALSLSSIWPKVIIVKEDADAALRMWTLGLMIEDRAEYGPSYAQFLANLREKVASHT